MRKIASLSPNILIILFVILGASVTPALAELINQQISTLTLKQNGKSFELSPDGQTIVFVADHSLGLFSAPADGQNTGDDHINLGIGDEIAPGFYHQDIQDFKISSNSQFVVFRQTINNQTELYSVPIKGGDRVKLSGELAPEGDVSSNYVINSDSTAVAYLADQDQNDVYELYIAPITGGGAVKLNGPLQPNQNVGTGESANHAFKFSPDGQRVVFAVIDKDSEKYDLFAVSSSGGDTVQLNKPVLTGIDNSFFRADFVISPDSQHVLYYADQETAGMYELYIVPIAGGEQTKLNPALIEGGDVEIAYFTPDGSRVVYIADQDVDDAFHLYSVPAMGGSVVKLSDPDVDLAYPVKIDPTGKRVVYVGWQGLGGPDSKLDLFSVSVAGGENTKLNGELPSGSKGFNLYFDYSFDISSDGQTVVYRLDQDEVNVYELYSVAINGGNITKLNAPLVEEGDVGGDREATPKDFKISPNGAFVYYLADAEIDGKFELYKAPIAGGIVKKMNAPLPEGEIVGKGDASSFAESFLLGSDNYLVAYIAGATNNKRLFISKMTPEITSQPKRVAFLELPYSYTIIADDINDNATLHFSADDLPAWLTLTDHGDGTATLAGRPTADKEQAYEISIKVTNSDGLIDVQTFTLVVITADQMLYIPIIQTGE